MDITSQKVTINITHEDIYNPDTGISVPKYRLDEGKYNVDLDTFQKFVETSNDKHKQEQLELIALCKEKKWSYALYCDSSDNYKHLIYKAPKQVVLYPESNEVYFCNFDSDNPYQARDVDASDIYYNYPDWYYLGYSDTGNYKCNIIGAVIDCTYNCFDIDVIPDITINDIKERMIEEENKLPQEDTNDDGLPLGVSVDDLCRDYCCEWYCGRYHICDYANTEFCDDYCEDCIAYVTSHYRDGCDAKDCAICADMVTVLEKLDFYHDEFEHCETSLLFVKKHDLAGCQIKDCNVCKTCLAFLNLHDSKCDIDDECELCNTKKNYVRDVRSSCLGSMISL